MNTIEPSTFAAFSLVPIFLVLLYLVVTLGGLIFLVVMIFRFVKAHEKIARSLEAIVLQRASEPKEKE